MEHSPRVFQYHFITYFQWHEFMRFGLFGTSTRIVLFLSLGPQCPVVRGFMDGPFGKQRRTVREASKANARIITQPLATFCVFFLSNKRFLEPAPTSTKTSTMTDTATVNLTATLAATTTAVRLWSTSAPVQVYAAKKQGRSLDM